MNIEIDTSDTVTKDGAVIGKIHDGTCYLTASVGPTVKAAINSENDAKLTFVVGEPPAESEQVTQDSNPPPQPEANVQAAQSTDPMPPRDPVLGSKCPKLIAWKARQKGGK